MTADAPLTLHASAVAVGPRAVLITGKSGSGKSALALEMMVRGAVLVADDHVNLDIVQDRVLLHCPDTIAGMIEARGIGILHCEHVPAAELALVVDMDQVETERMPPRRNITYLSKTFPLLHNVASQHFAAAIVQYLRGKGRVDVEP
ncbi:HPr kinase/phosphorylase [Marivita sp. S2033]|uniref:HPr kinase/phosphorylase n=1 Tax=Marivita sp. S2033 TaxID=3373187 RepID=UPI003981CCB4